MLAIVYLSDKRVAVYEVENKSYFDVKSDAERKLRNFGDYRKVIDVKFIEAQNILNGTQSELKTQSGINFK